MFSRLSLFFSLAACPLLGLAQTAATGPHFYVGLSGAYLTSEPFSSRYSQLHPVGVALTGGVTFTPRLAVQVSPSLLGANHTFTYNYSLSSGPPASGYATSHVRARYLSVPLLVRYTFTSPASRLHVEALGGGQLLNILSLNNYDEYVSGQPVDSHAQTYRTTDFYLTLGPGLRYSLTPALDLTATVPVSYQLTSTVVNDFTDRLLLNPTLGVSYQLGH